jgi:hypothetical protein
MYALMLCRYYSSPYYYNTYNPLVYAQPNAYAAQPNLNALANPNAYAAQPNMLAQPNPNSYVMQQPSNVAVPNTQPALDVDVSSLVRDKFYEASLADGDNCINRLLCELNAKVGGGSLRVSPCKALMGNAT